MYDHGRYVIIFLKHNDLRLSIQDLSKLESKQK